MNVHWLHENASIRFLWEGDLVPVRISDRYLTLQSKSGKWEPDPEGAATSDRERLPEELRRARRDFPSGINQIAEQVADGIELGVMDLAAVDAVPLSSDYAVVVDMYECQVFRFRSPTWRIQPTFTTADSPIVALHREHSEWLLLDVESQTIRNRGSTGVFFGSLVGGVFKVKSGDTLRVYSVSSETPWASIDLDRFQVLCVGADRSMILRRLQDGAFLIRWYDPAGEANYQEEFLDRTLGDWKLLDYTPSILGADDFLAAAPDNPFHPCQQFGVITSDGKWLIPPVGEAAAEVYRTIDGARVVAQRMTSRQVLVADADHPGPMRSTAFLEPHPSAVSKVPGVSAAAPFFFIGTGSPLASDAGQRVVDVAEFVPAMGDRSDSIFRWNIVWPRATLKAVPADALELCEHFGVPVFRRIRISDSDDLREQNLAPFVIRR